MGVLPPDLRKDDPLSEGPRFPFEVAYATAEEVSERLSPTLERLKAVGSLRRRRPSVGDLEFLAVPFFDEDLFGGDPKPCLDPVRLVLRELGTWVKGGDRFMQVKDLLGTEGLSLDLYLAHPPAEWGSLEAIRTGPRLLGLLCMMRLAQNGYTHQGGRVLKSGKLVPTPTEEDFFGLAGIECLPPNQRDAQAAQLKRAEL